MILCNRGNFFQPFLLLATYLLIGRLSTILKSFFKFHKFLRCLPKTQNCLLQKADQTDCERCNKINVYVRGYTKPDNAI